MWSLDSLSLIVKVNFSSTSFKQCLLLMKLLGAAAYHFNLIFQDYYNSFTVAVVPALKASANAAMLINYILNSCTAQMEHGLESQAVL